MNSIVLQLFAEKARRSFYQYCRLLAKDWYKPNRLYLKRMADETQDFIESDDNVLIINAPPRHGKSRLGTDLCSWVLGKWPDKKIMTGSYNEVLSQTFSREVRNRIQTEKADPLIPVYNDVFKGIHIKEGDGAVNRWSLDGRHASYLATSPTGTATGFGADLLIIDDLIKSAEEANNANVLEKLWLWFTNTMLSRLEEGGKIIIIMTRWHSVDLAGRAIRHFEEIGQSVRQLTLKALQDDGTMLCEDVLSRKSYEDKIKTIGLDIASANYQQEPIDITGKLYGTFKTYDKLPMNDQGQLLIDGIYSYTDTADEGPDWLCSIIWAEYKNQAYILDVLYTKSEMEKTERQTAERLTQHEVVKAFIESNNGGRGFARNVQRNCQELGNFFTVIRWFHQSKNKNARILTNATWIMENVYMPVNWMTKWPDFCRDITTYQREGKNKHDDCADALTGVAENASRSKLGAVKLGGV